MWRMPHRYLWHKAPTPAQGRFDGIWSISYADLMTLLLCFFVVMLMVCPPAVAHGDKAHSVMASLRTAFGMTDSQARGVGAASKQGTLVEQLAAMTEQGREGGLAASGRQAVSLSHESDGLHITVRGDQAFDGATASNATLAAGTERTLRQMATALVQLNPGVELRAYAGPNERSGKIAKGAATERRVASLEAGFTQARAVADVLSQCGLPIDRFQVLVVRDGASAGVDRGVSVREPGMIDVIVQARPDPGGVPSAASDLSAARR